jgi:hypothetical protein
LSRIDWTAIAIKFFAAFQVFGALSYAASASVFFISLSNNDPNMYASNFITVTAILSIAVPILASVILWRKALPIANWMWREDAEGKSHESKLSATSFFKVKAAVLTGIGIFIFITRIPAWFDSLGVFFGYYFSPDSPLIINQSNPFTYDMIINIGSRFVQLILASVFILAPKRVLVFLDKIQDTWDLITEV